MCDFETVDLVFEDVKVFSGLGDQLLVNRARSRAVVWPPKSESKESRK